MSEERKIFQFLSKTWREGNRGEIKKKKQYQDLVSHKESFGVNMIEVQWTETRVLVLPNNSPRFTVGLEDVTASSLALLGCLPASTSSSHPPFYARFYPPYPLKHKCCEISIGRYSIRCIYDFKLFLYLFTRDSCKMGDENAYGLDIKWAYYNHFI